MKKLIFITAALISILWSPVNISASPFKNISVENGLSNRKVLASTIDNKGYIWFATQNGIDRYNGESFRFFQIPDKNNRRQEIPKGIICSPKGEIYAFSSNYIYYYDKSKDKIIIKDFELDNNESINAVYFDSHGGLWIGSTQHLYYSEDMEVFCKINDQKMNFISINGSDRDIWVGTIDGLYNINDYPNRDKKLIKHENISCRVQSLFFDEKTNYLWIGTFNKGLRVINLENGKEFELAHDKLNLPIRDIVSIDNSTIWLSIDGGGIGSFDRFSLEMKNRYSTTAKGNDFIITNNIYDITPADNMVWITTYNAGIIVFNKNSIVQSTYLQEHKSSNSISDNHINAILEDSKGNLWFGTNMGLSMYDTRQKLWKNFNDGNSANKVILSIFEDSKNRIWTSGYAADIACIDLNTMAYKTISLPNSQTPKKNFVYSIIEDNEGYIWFGGILNDLLRYNPQDNSYKTFPIKNINNMSFWGYDKILIASGNGLIIINTKTENINHVNLKKCKGGKALHSNPFINYAVEYPKSSGIIWISTDSDGVYIYDTNNNELERISTIDGLSSNTTYGIMGDENNNMWISTENGLNRYNPEIKNIDVFSTMDGLTSNAFNFKAFCKRKNGNLIWGSFEGAIEITPSEVAKNGKPEMNLYFEEFALFYNKVTAESDNSPLKHNIDDTESIRLKYNQHSFSFDFISLNENKNAKTLYSWYLEGFDKQWSVPSRGHKATYTNVPPGDYTFRVKSYMSGNKENSETREIKIHISKPIWATTLAMLIYVILGLYIVYMIAKAYKNKLEAKDSDQKIRFFINIAHDIRTPLTLIKAPLNEIEGEKLSENGKSALVLAQKNTEKLLSMVSQLLDFQKLEREAMKLYVEETNLNDYIENCLTSFQLLAKEKHLFLDIKLPEEKHTGWIDRKKISLITDNLVSNAIKYTNEHGNICVDVKIKNNSLVLNVIDDGIGISAEAQKKLFNRFYRADNTANSKETGSGIGLMLTKKMVTLHKGKITLSSKENIGTTFTVEIPINRNSYNDNEILYKEERTKLITKTDNEEDNTNRLKIVLVEDNDELREYLSRLLNRNYLVSDAPNGEEGLEKIKREMPDFIVSDVMMPGISGIELCRKIKSDIDTCHIPVILLTALSEREDIIKGLNAGADDYLTKPFDLNILESKINTIIKNRKLFRKKYIDKTALTAEEAGMNELDMNFMNKVVAYIEEKMSNEDFSIDNLSIEMAMSRSVFYKKIKSLVGQNPQDFIRDIKMKKAANLLREKKYSIGEIAYLTGFPNAKYFSTAFKKYYGVSPSLFNGQEKVETE